MLSKLKYLKKHKRAKQNDYKETKWWAPSCHLNLAKAKPSLFIGKGKILIIA